MRKAVSTLLAAGLLGLGLCVTGAEAPPGPAEPGTLLVVDARGKEQKLRAWKFAAGTRRLSWLAAAPNGGGDKGGKSEDRPEEPTGPEALVVRDEAAIKYAEGVVTLVPLDRLRSLEFDNDKEVVSARVAGGKGDEVLTGSTRYRGINKVVLEAEVDKGDLGLAEVKFLGGVPNGIRAIRFPPPRPAPGPAAGRPALVTSDDGAKQSTHPVTDLGALYRLKGGEQLLPTLFFRKTVKLDLARVRKLVSGAGAEDETSWQVTLKGDGDETLTLTLLQAVQLEGKRAQLEGLVGRVPAGYKLFPVRSVVAVTFDTQEQKDDKPPAKD